VKTHSLDIDRLAFWGKTRCEYLYIFDMLDFHKACLKEMERICRRQVRIFPLAGDDEKP